MHNYPDKVVQFYFTLLHITPPSYRVNIDSDIHFLASLDIRIDVFDKDQILSIIHEQVIF